RFDAVVTEHPFHAGQTHLAAAVEHAVADHAEVSRFRLAKRAVDQRAADQQGGDQQTAQNAENASHERASVPVPAKKTAPSQAGYCAQRSGGSKVNLASVSDPSFYTRVSGCGVRISHAVTRPAALPQRTSQSVSGTMGKGRRSDKLGR